MLLKDYFGIIAAKLRQSIRKGKMDYFMQGHLSSELQIVKS